MARTVTPLTDPKCEAAKPREKPYKLSDGKGLYLLVKPGGGKTWRMKYHRPDGRENTLTFGDYPATTLKAARTKAATARALLAQEIDPAEQARQEQESTALTFEKVAREWHAARSIRWSKDHANTVLRRMELHLFPTLGPKPVASLKLRDLLMPIKAVETRGTLEAANRLSQYTASVMRHATQNDYIETNPAIDLAGAIATHKTGRSAA